MPRENEAGDTRELSMRSNTKHSSARVVFGLAVFLMCCAPAFAKDERAKPKPSERGAERAAAADGWTIVLASYSGDDHAGRALAALERVKALGLVDARTEGRAGGSIVALGNYGSPGDAQAKADLARVRGVTANGEPVFPGAFLAPPKQDEGGATAANDLRGARDEFGKSVRYTLQVGVYEAKDREESKRAAEKAAAALRRAGEPAYYFHGPQRSMVTVGAFTEKEARAFMDRASGQTTGAGAPELWELFRRHPQNLLNGNLSLMEKPIGADADAKGKKGETKGGKAQSSFLVQIP